MAFTSGLVSRFTNTLITTDEIIGAGNGSQTVFNYTLLNPTVFLDTVKIKYTVATVVYTVTANSSGNFIGTHITSGTVNEAGVIALTFSTAPDNGTNVLVDEYKCKGLLTKFLEYVATNKFTQNLGTGNGSQTIFSTALSNTPVAKGQCRVKFKIAGTIYDVWDDGEGNFIHALITTGTINYASGAVAFVFVAAIDNSYVMVLLYTNGAEGRDWLVMMQQNSKNGTNTADAFPGLELQEVVLKNSGIGYKEEIYVGIREFQYIAEGLFGWNYNLYTIWANQQELGNSWNHNSTSTGLSSYDTTRNFWNFHPMTPVNNGTISYRFYTNKRRMVCVFQCSGTVFTGNYLGGFRAFAAPSNYPKSQIVIGNVFGAVPFSSTAGNLLSIIHSVVGTANHYMGLLPSLTYFFGDKVRQLPAANYSNTGQLKKVANKVLLNPSFLYKHTPTPLEALGVLDDVYHTPSTGLVVNDILQHAGKDYRVFQNIFRTAYQDYFAVLEE